MTQYRKLPWWLEIKSRCDELMGNKGSNINQKIVVPVDAAIQDIVQDFLRHRGENVTSIRDALEAGDFDTVRRIGHDIEGSGGAFGFERIAEIGRCLSCSPSDAPLAEFQGLADELASYLARLKIVYVNDGGRTPLTGQESDQIASRQNIRYPMTKIRRNPGAGV